MAIITTFFLLCVPMRILITYLAYIWRYKTDDKSFTNRYLLSITLLAISIYWIVSASLNFRNVWWNSHKPIHAFNYITFSILSLMNYPFAFIFLLIDVLFGIVVFVLNYHKKLYSYYNNLYKFFTKYQIRIVKG